MKSVMLPKILIVEDCDDWKKVFLDWFKGETQVLIAATPKKAKTLIDQNPDIMLLAVDGTLVKDLDGNTSYSICKKERLNMPYCCNLGRL